MLAWDAVCMVAAIIVISSFGCGEKVEYKFYYKYMIIMPAYDWTMKYVFEIK